MSQKAPDCTVLGAGIVSVSCALYLQREGYSVALIETAQATDMSLLQMKASVDAARLGGRDKIGCAWASERSKTPLSIGIGVS